MKILPTSFTERGFSHQQITRAGRIALFERQKGKASPHYEVVIIHSHNGFKIPGTDKMAPPAECYPSPSVWGAKGWTYNDRTAAEHKFHSLLTFEL